MSPKFYKKSDFHKLRKEWYEKLKEEGFDDIEWTSKYGKVSHLMKNSSGAIRRDYRFATEQFYQIVANFVTHYSFDSKLDLEIMQMLEKGFSYRKMSKELKKKGFPANKSGISPASICLRLKTLREIMFEWDKTNPEGLTYTRQLFEDFEDFTDYED